MELIKNENRDYYKTKFILDSRIEDGLKMVLKYHRQLPENIVEELREIKEKI